MLIAQVAQVLMRGGGRPPHVCVGVAWLGILLIWEAASLSRTAELHPIGSNPTLESLCCGCLRAPEPLEYGFGPKIMNWENPENP